MRTRLRTTSNGAVNGDDAVLFCDICQERPADCMGGVCTKCDHQLSDREDPEEYGEPEED